MALHWNIENCKDFKSLTNEESGEWTITNALIWQTMMIDMGQITPTNIAEFYGRIKVVETFSWIITKYNDTTNKREQYKLTFGDIEKRIGLSTNVSTVPFSKWIKRMDTFNHKEENGVSLNKMMAAYYSALTEVEQYTTSITKEAVSA
jgi:hypothetical protein